MSRYLTLLALLVSPFTTQAATFDLKDGDRVVFLGSTFIEREQTSGYWEQALTTRFAGKKVVFRNLGWSGDNVFGHAWMTFSYTRTGSRSLEAGFKYLKDHTLSLKPTWIIVGYGSTESFEGKEGLDKFTKGLNTLLDTLAPTKAKIVLLSPMRQGTMPEPLPDPSAQNKNLKLYSEAIAAVARKRGAIFADLYEAFGDIGKVKPAVTENGIHLTPRGYAWSAPKFEKALGLEEKGRRTVVEGTKFTIKDGLLTANRLLVVKGLKAGTYQLTSGKTIIASADASAWAKGVILTKGPEAEQAEKLRKLIVSKNELYFHRWRPQNETYLFGFRKHEQGRNASEIPKFDPLIAAKEKEIAKLAGAVKVEYELKAVK